VTLRGRVGATNVAFSFPAKLSDAAGPDFLARLWAHREVAFLLDEIRINGEKKE
jgi:Ca-activated chloride channel family protein